MWAILSQIGSTVGSFLGDLFGSEDEPVTVIVKQEPLPWVLIIVGAIVIILVIKFL